MIFDIEKITKTRHCRHFSTFLDDYLKKILSILTEKNTLPKPGTASTSAPFIKKKPALNKVLECRECREIANYVLHENQETGFKQSAGVPGVPGNLQTVFSRKSRHLL